MQATAAPEARGRASLAARLFAGQLAVLAAVALLVGAATYRFAEGQVRGFAAQRVASVAETLAHDPYVVASVDAPDPTARLQPFTREILATAAVDFVTIMAPDGTRYTHPNPARIGGRYIGSREQALAGRTHTETYTGTLGPSVRTIVPVRDGAGRIRALVAVGVTLDTLEPRVADLLPPILVAAAAVVLLGGAAAWVQSRYLRRATLGYGPEELRRLFAYYDSALHSLHEGLALVDRRGRLVLYNDQAAALLDLPPEGALRPVPVSELPVPESLRDLFASARRTVDEIHLTERRVLVVSQQPAAAPAFGPATRLPFRLRPDQYPGGGLGTVVTLRDHTELQALAGELETLRTLSDALRAQTHEHSNRLHTVATLIELGRPGEALDFAVRDRQEAQRLTDDVVRSIDEPFLAALLVGKAAQAHERGVELSLSAAGTLPAGALDARDLVTITGNLIDNALDAAAGSEQRRVWVDLAASDGELVLTVADSGPGVDPEHLEGLLRLGATSKPAAGPGGRGLGLALVRQSVGRLGGTLAVDNDGGAIFTVTLPLPGGAPRA